MANEFIARKGFISLDGAQITGSLSATGNISSNTLTVTNGITGTATSASYVEYSNVAGKPALVSSSAQIVGYGVFATTSSNTFQGNQTITGSLFITQNLVVAGSSSIQYISSSIVDIADNIITVNAFNPGVRFGGLAVADSGSSPRVSGSILFDSIKDQWIFVHENQTVITSSVVLMGPETYNDLGNEAYISANRLPKGSGIEHLRDSNITDTGTSVSINSNTLVTGSFTVITGSAVELQVTNIGVNLGSALTDSHIISGSLTVNPNGLFVSGSGNVGIGTTNPDGTLVVAAGTNGTASTGGYIGLTTGVNNSKVRGAAIETFTTGTGNDHGLRFYTNEAASSPSIRLILNSSGNLGLGVTPSAWTWRAAQVGNAALAAVSNVGFVSANAFFDGAYKYISNGASQVLEVNNANEFRFLTAASGTAGNAITFTQAMTLDASGNLLIGATSNISSTRRELVMRGANGSVVSLGNNTTADRFQIVSDSGENALLNNKANTPMIFYTNNTEYMRITASGNVGIGTSSPSFTLDVNGTGRFLSNSSSTIGLIVGGAGGAGSTRQGQLRFGDAGTVYKIQGGEDYSAINFMIGTGTPLTLASNGAATFSSSVTATNLVTTSMSGGAITIRGDETLNSNFGIVWTTPTYTGGIAAIRVARRGASDASDMMFFTSPNGDVPNERMRITSGGNVLIGTTSNDTGARLRVNGMGWFDGQIFSVQSNGTVRTSNADAAGMLHIRPNAGQNGYINFTENAVDDRWSIGITAADGNLYFRRPYPTSPAVVTISPAGYLALGDTAVPGSAWAGTAILGVSGSNKIITGYLASSTSGAVIGAHNSALNAWANLNINGSNLIFRINGETEAMRINSSGNVGIGTTSPSGRFHVTTTGITASSPSLGWPVYNAELDTNARLIYIDTAGNGDTPTAGSGASVVLQLGQYYDSRVVITPIGSGGAGPSDQGTGRGKDLMIKAGTSDNGAGLKGGRLYLNGGMGYQSAFNANGGDILMQVLTGSGNVGIGTATPSQKLEVVGGEIKAGRVDTTNEGGQVSFGRASDNATGWYIDAFGSTSTPALRFVDVSNSAVRMTITSGGEVLVGMTSNTGASITSVRAGLFSGQRDNAIDAVFQAWNQGTSGDNQFVHFYTEGGSGTYRGNIDFNRGAGLVRYNTSSDYRLKSEIEDFNASEIILNLKPKKYRIGDAEQKTIGFIAHELQEYYPQAVSGTKDQVNQNGDPIYQGVDYSQLTGLLVKGIQELKSENDALKEILQRNNIS